MNNFQAMGAIEHHFEHSTSSLIFPYDKELSVVELSRVIHRTIFLFEVIAKFLIIYIFTKMCIWLVPWTKIAQPTLIFARNITVFLIHSDRNFSTGHLLTVSTLSSTFIVIHPRRSPATIKCRIKVMEQ